MEVGSIWNPGGLLWYLLGRGLWKKKGQWEQNSESPHPEMGRGRRVSQSELGPDGGRVGKRVGGMSRGQEGAREAKSGQDRPGGAKRGTAFQKGPVVEVENTEVGQVG